MTENGVDSAGYQALLRGLLGSVGLQPLDISASLKPRGSTDEPTAVSMIPSLGWRNNKAAKRLCVGEQELGSAGRIRTYDKSVNSRLLYH